MNVASSTTVSEWLSQSQNRLEIAGIETARLDSLVILSDELGHDKAWVLAHPEYCIQGSVLKKLNTKILEYMSQRNVRKKDYEKMWRKSTKIV